MRLMYINGELTKKDAREEIEVANPATEEEVDTVPRGTAEEEIASRRLAMTLLFDCGKMTVACGSRQVVRHQPSKLIFVGSNPISRSENRCQVSSFQVSRDTGTPDT